jgi:hypothetical protein
MRIPGFTGELSIGMSGLAYVGSSPHNQRPRGITAADGCVCYCNGTSWSPGADACMGGWKYRCVDRNNDGTNCGWDPIKQGSDQVPCDGGENCK